MCVYIGELMCLVATIVIVKFKRKLRKKKTESLDKHFNVHRLKEEEYRSKFAVELQNRYEILSQIPVDDIDTEWEQVEKT